jgi:hypothetical protein
VALERRNGRLYYYRSVRDAEGRPRKVYVGSGELARIAHERELMQRARKEHRREEERSERERLEALAAPLAELEEITQILTRAHLIATGHHRHKREWRLRRESA